MTICEVDEHTFSNSKNGIYECTKCGLKIDIEGVHKQIADNPHYGDTNKHSWECLIESAYDEGGQELEQV